MRRHKGLIIIFICIIIGFIGFEVFYISTKEQWLTYSGTFNGMSFVQKIPCDYNYKKININLEVKNKTSINNVKYDIKKPNGEVLASGIINSGDNKKIVKNFMGIKGTWKVELSREKSDKSFSYSLNFKGNNK